MRLASNQLLPPSIPKGKHPMTAQSTTASITVTMLQNYDRHLGPILFEFTAADMAKRVTAALTGLARVFEVACGTGISTRHLAGALLTGRKIQATNLNKAILSHAAKVNGHLPCVTYNRPTHSTCCSTTLAPTRWSASSALCFFPTNQRECQSLPEC